MPTKAKRKTYNLLMALAIVIILVSGLMAVGHLKGWFGGQPAAGGGNEASLLCSSTTGVVQVERSGVGYTLKSDTVMQSGDTAETKNGSEAVFAWQGSGSKESNTIALNEKSELVIDACSEEELALTLNEGELFAAVPDAPAALSISYGGSRAEITGTVFSISKKGNAGTLCVYEGTVDVLTEKGESLSVSTGEQLLVTTNKKGELETAVSEMTADMLSPYMIEKLLGCGSSGLCFSEKELNKVTAAREQEKLDADKALEEASIKIAENEKNNAAENGQTASQTQDGTQADGSTGSSGDNGSGSAGNSSQPADTSSGSGGGNNNGSGGSGSSGGSDSASDIKTCTITIECSSILDNMENLKEGKDRYVPANGVILATSAVEFRDGETAYDVTKRACEALGIQIEASYVPLYESYYVEGINHLYEFDCGGMSGWLYRVNGWTPNYGCSEYTLQDGDSIVWEYTCTGN